MEKELYLKKVQNIYDKFIDVDIIDSFKTFFKIICKEFGFLSPVGAKKSKELREENAIYRGVGGQRKFMVNLVCESNPEKIYIGDGTYGMGTYCSKSFSEAFTYACRNKKNVIKMYLDNPNLIRYNDLTILKNIIAQEFHLRTDAARINPSVITTYLNELKHFEYLFEFIKSKKNLNSQEKFLHYLLSNETNIAAILGYDAVEISSLEYSENFTPIYLILNKQKIFVEKSFRKGLERNHKKTLKHEENGNNNLKESQMA